MGSPVGAGDDGGAGAGDDGGVGASDDGKKWGKNRKNLHIVPR